MAPENCLIVRVRHPVGNPKRKVCIVIFADLYCYLCYCFAYFLYFIFACIFLSKIQKKSSSFIVVIFTCLLFSLARMSNPEVEVHTFKQQGGESLKDAWYQNSNAHHRCTNKHSTMILDKNLFESLVGVPPVNVVKTEITLEEVLEKLSSLEKSLPNILDNASQVNKSIESIGKRITVLEASTTHDSQNFRIGKLEESMENLSSVFSSLKFKKEKAFVGKEQKIMYVPKVSMPKP
jgi:DNA-directed RNA polymerase subunit H (RpoH/RPB5)